MSINKIIKIDLDYKDNDDNGDNLKGIRFYLINSEEILEDNLLLKLFIITASESIFISHYKIKKLPSCLLKKSSLINFHRLVHLKIGFDKLNTLEPQPICEKEQCKKGCFSLEEFTQIINRYEEYSKDELNLSQIKPPIEIELFEK